MARMSIKQSLFLENFLRSFAIPYLKSEEQIRTEGGRSLLDDELTKEQWQDIQMRNHSRAGGLLSFSFVCINQLQYSLHHNAGVLDDPVLIMKYHDLLACWVITNRSKMCKTTSLSSSSSNTFSSSWCRDRSFRWGKERTGRLVALSEEFAVEEVLNLLATKHGMFGALS
eukprot:scaffold4260_cov178-Ochromonas_danica.AAC.3